jgi:hypothetical protein
MAAKKKKKPSAASRAKRQKAIDKSASDVMKAHKTLDLHLKKHKKVLSAMFFAA